MALAIRTCLPRSERACQRGKRHLVSAATAVAAAAAAAAAAVAAAARAGWQPTAWMREPRVQGGRAPLVACRCEPLYRVGLAAAAGLVHASYVTMQPYLQHPGYRNTCNKHELCDPGCGRACAAWHAWQYHMHGRHWRLCDRVAREHSTLALMCLVCSKRCLVQGVAHPTRAGTLPPGLAPAGAPLAQHTPACTRRGVSQARGSAQTRQACPRLHHMQPPSTGPVPQAMSRQPSSGQAWVSKSTCVERRPTRYVTGCTGARR